MKKYRFLRPWWIVLYCVLIWGIVRLFMVASIPLDTTIEIEEWGSIATSDLYDSIWGIDRLRLKRYIRNNQEVLTPLQPWSYSFSWTYTPEEVVEVFAEWPSQEYDRITVLEWRSVFDTDRLLADKWWAEPWEYRAFVENSEIIDRYIQRYPFLTQAQEDRWWLDTLEWYLYPNTYFIDREGNVIDQLVYLQLESFAKRIWEPYWAQLAGLSDQLASLWYQFTLTTHWALILASVIEKEERVDTNKPLIASIFYNRLNDGMRIDADITLCYGLEVPYETCTPRVIWTNIRDASNPYNTRAVGWLPPTPISSVTSASISALLDATPSDFYYYLHDQQGQIHTARNLPEHNQNKSKYIN